MKKNKDYDKYYGQVLNALKGCTKDTAKSVLVSIQNEIELLEAFQMAKEVIDKVDE